MIVEYSHQRYDLQGSVDTDSYAASFLFARKPLAAADQPVIPESSRVRFLKNIESVAALNHIESIDSADTSQPTFVRISGNIITEPPENVYGQIPMAAMRVMGPVTPEIMEQSLARVHLGSVLC